MNTPDEDLQFEEELKRFRPREVAPFPTRPHLPLTALRALGAAAAILFVLSGIWLWHLRTTHPPAAVSSDVDPSATTLGGTRATLAHAPSFEDAIDRLERDSTKQTSAAATNDHSALQALGKERL